MFSWVECDHNEARAAREAIGAQLEMASSPNHTTVYIPVGSNGLPLVHTLER